MLVFKCISSTNLLNYVSVPRPFVMDVVLKFYANLCVSMFDAKSLDYHKGFARGKFFDFSPALIDLFVSSENVVETHVNVDPDVVVARITQKKDVAWHTKGVFPASALSREHKVLY